MVTKAQVEMMLISAYMLKTGRVKERAWNFMYGKGGDEEKARIVADANAAGIEMPELGRFVLGVLKRR